MKYPIFSLVSGKLTKGGYLPPRIAAHYRRRRFEIEESRTLPSRVVRIKFTFTARVVKFRVCCLLRYYICRANSNRVAFFYLGFIIRIRWNVCVGTRLNLTRFNYKYFRFLLNFLIKRIFLWFPCFRFQSLVALCGKFKICSLIYLLLLPITIFQFNFWIDIHAHYRIFESELNLCAISFLSCLAFPICWFELTKKSILLLK